MNNTNEHGKVVGIAVFAIDPGVTTGVGWCAIPTKILRENHSSDAVAWALNEGFGDLKTVDCRNEMDGALEIVEYYQECAIALSLLGSGNLRVFDAVVIEDFVLRAGAVGSRSFGSTDLLSPVRIGHLVHGMLVGSGDKVGVKYQTPSSAKSIINDTRLKDWGMWIEGMSTHERDVLRHIIFYFMGIDLIGRQTVTLKIGEG